ncbi:hypothetical protein GCM10027577_00190 [Spirosoma fluminis]
MIVDAKRFNSFAFANAVPISDEGNNTDGGTAVGLLGVTLTSRKFVQLPNPASNGSTRAALLNIVFIDLCQIIKKLER